MTPDTAWAICASALAVGMALLAGWVQLRAKAAVAQASATTERLDAAALRVRTAAALARGHEACAVLVRALDEEAARGECATCAQLRVELAESRRLEREATAAHIAELRAVLPALAASAASQDVAAEAMHRVVDAMQAGG